MGSNSESIYQNSLEINSTTIGDGSASSSSGQTHIRRSFAQACLRRCVVPMSLSCLLSSTFLLLRGLAGRDLHLSLEGEPCTRTCSSSSQDNAAPFLGTCPDPLVNRLTSLPHSLWPIQSWHDELACQHALESVWPGWRQLAMRLGW